MSLANKPAFFAALRTGLLGPTLEQDEVDGVNTLTDALDGFPLAHVAYALATAYHETAHTMQPIQERGGNGYFFRRYDPQGEHPSIAAALGNTHPGDGVAFCGRGYVQLTGRANYAKAEHDTGFALSSQPYLAMRPDIAARIMREGMTQGWFTGKRLSDFLPAAGLADGKAFTQARKTINGMDCAGLIAGYAMRFQDALRAGGWS
jgi:putative chitinase